MAGQLDVSPRELIGVLKKVTTYADLTHRPVTMELADDAIASRGRRRAKSA